MKFLILLSSVFIMLARCEIEEENDVLIVTIENWDEVVNDDTMALIEFCEYLKYVTSYDFWSKKKKIG